MVARASDPLLTCPLKRLQQPTQHLKRTTVTTHTFYTPSHQIFCTLRKDKWSSNKRNGALYTRPFTVLFALLLKKHWSMHDSSCFGSACCMCFNVYIFVFSQSRKSMESCPIILQNTFKWKGSEKWWKTINLLVSEILVHKIHPNDLLSFTRCRTFDSDCTVAFTLA